MGVSTTIGLAGGLWALASAACAQGAEPAHPDGARLALACTACHGLSPEPAGSIPPIWGRDAAELAALMTAYADGSAEGTVMPRLMRDYSAEEIAALADYLSGDAP